MGTNQTARHGGPGVGDAFGIGNSGANYTAPSTASIQNAGEILSRTRTLTILNLKTELHRSIRWRLHTPKLARCGRGGTFL
jgi:hypothetical protein